METNEITEVTDREKELCAVSTLRRAVEIYSDRNNVPYDEAFLDFASSNTYKVIFDFDTGVWKEGPEYFLALYEEEIECCNNSTCSVIPSDSQD